MGDFIVHRARFFDYQPKAVQSMSYDDNFKKLAISRSDNTIEIWSTKNEYLESIITPASDRQVEVVLWCRSQLLSAGLDGFIVLYDLSRLTAKKLYPSIGGAIWCMTRNKSETRIAIGTEDGYVVLYEMMIDGVLFEKTFNKQDTRILSIVWHKDEEMLVTGGIDNIRVWDANSGQVMQRISLGRIEKNKETLVWCLAITSGFNIISGDSRGKVSVWNAEQGSLIKSFQTHAVDVLCLCMDESEKRIYCSGIDPSIVQLDYVMLNETDKYKTWVKSSVYLNHSHDVRSILIANDQLVSAGVDTKIVFKCISDKQSHTIRKYNSMPQKAVVDSCEDFVLLQYEKHLELWKLGQTTINNDEIKEKHDGDCLPLLRLPRKFVHLESKNGLHIVCSSIGSNPVSTDNSHVIWLSYSDLNVIHIYKIEMSSKHVLEPKIKINKIKALPLACGNRPAVLMKFFNYQAQQDKSLQLRLCYLTNKSCLQCLKLVKDDDSGFMLESTIQCIQQDNLIDNRIYMMACQNDYVATADTDLNVSIWHLNNQQIIFGIDTITGIMTNIRECCMFDEHTFESSVNSFLGGIKCKDESQNQKGLLATLPRYECLTSCFSFHPTKNYLLNCYTDRKLVEYDFEQNEYTDWSRKTSEKYPKQWLKQHTKLLSCFYDQADNDKIITYDEQHFVVINKNENMPDNPNEKIFSQQSLIQNSTKNSNLTGETNSEENIPKVQSALHISNKYRYIIHASQPAKGQLLIVEVTPLSVTERLPPSLKQKKFGT